MAKFVLRPWSRAGLIALLYLIDSMEPKVWISAFVNSWVVWPIIIILALPFARDLLRYAREKLRFKVTYTFDHASNTWKKRRDWRRRQIKRVLRRVDMVTVAIAMLLIVSSAAGALIWRPTFFVNEEPQAYADFESPWQVYPFSLLRQPGAELRLAECPGPRCIRFLLRDIEFRSDPPFAPADYQLFELDGDGLSWTLRRGTRGTWDANFNIQMTAVGPGTVMQLFRIAGPGQAPEAAFGAIALTEGSSLRLCTTTWDMIITIVSVQSTDYRLEVRVKPGTYDRCSWFEDYQNG